MRAEALVKVGDSAQWVDGQIISLREPGMWVTLSRLRAWVAGSMPVHPPLVGMINRFRTRDDFDEQLEVIEAHGGFHCSYGFGDLKDHALIVVEVETLEFTSGATVDLNLLSEDTLARVRDATQLVVPPAHVLPFLI